MGVERRDGREAEGAPATASEPSGAPVPPRKATKQAPETPARWAWVEPTVWTPRMLAALENGVKGGR